MLGNRKLFFILCVWCCKISFGQFYNPTIGDSNMWNIIETFEATNTRTNVANRDTIINGLNYRKFEEVFYGVNTVYDCIAYIREDTLDQKIFIRTGDFLQDTIEYVLYDFSLNEGDSIQLYGITYWEVDSMGYYQVDSISEIELNGQIHKKFFLSGDPYVYPDRPENPIWIEGVGSLGDFMHPGISVDEFTRGVLSCFFKNGIKVFQSPDYDSCMVFFGDIEKHGNHGQIKVYPNPFKNSICILSEIPQDLRINIVNSLGQVVYSNRFFSISENEVNLSSFSDGVFIIQVYNDEFVLNQIIIKQADR